jgi:hypothetical protein
VPKLPKAVSLNLTVCAEAISVACIDSRWIFSLDDLGRQLGRYKLTANTHSPLPSKTRPRALFLLLFSPLQSRVEPPPLSDQLSSLRELANGSKPVLQPQHTDPVVFSHDAAAGELTSPAGIPSWLAWRRPVACEAAQWGLHGEDGPGAGDGCDAAFL